MPTQTGAPELVAQGQNLPPQQATAGPMSPPAEAISAAAAASQPPTPPPAQATPAAGPPPTQPQVPADHPVTIYAPDKTLVQTPATQLAAALKQGAKLAYPIVAPDGAQGYVPAAEYNNAKAAGAKPPEPQDVADAKSKGFWHSAYDLTLAMIPGIYHSVMDGPQNDEEEAISNASGGKTNPLTGRAALLAYRVAVAPAEQQAEMAKDPSMDPNERVGHGLAAITPIVGPWAASVAQTAGQQAGAGNWAGAGGTAFGAGAMAALPKIKQGVGAIIDHGTHSAADFARRGIVSMSGAPGDIYEAQRGADADYAAQTQSTVNSNAATRQSHVDRMATT